MAYSYCKSFLTWLFMLCFMSTHYTLWLGKGSPHLREIITNVYELKPHEIHTVCNTLTLMNLRNYADQFRVYRR